VAERVGFALKAEAKPEALLSQQDHPLRDSALRALLAERVGFEPTVGFGLHTLSKRAP